MRKKGSLADPIVWIIVSFITVVFLGFMVYIFGEINTAFMSVSNDMVRNATTATIGEVNSVIGPGLHTISFVIIFVSAISIFVHNFLVKAHPAFLITYVLMAIGSVIVSAYLSNYYMDLLDGDIIGPTLEGFTASNFIMQWLPLFTALIAIFGAVFLFIGIIRDRSGGVL